MTRRHKANGYNAPRPPHRHRLAFPYGFWCVAFADSAHMLGTHRMDLMVCTRCSTVFIPATGNHTPTQHHTKWMSFRGWARLTSDERAPWDIGLKVAR